MTRHFPNIFFLFGALPLACNGFTTGTTGTSPLLALPTPHGLVLRPDITAVDSSLSSSTRGEGVVRRRRRPRSPSLLSSPPSLLPLPSTRLVLAAHHSTRDSNSLRGEDHRSTTSSGSGKRTWPRRIWSRLRMRPLRMQTMDTETETALLDIDDAFPVTHYGATTSTTTSLSSREEFILRNFEDFAPPSATVSSSSSSSSRIRSDVPNIDAEFYNVNLVETAKEALQTSEVDMVAKQVAATPGDSIASTAKPPAIRAKVKAVFLSRWLGTVFENILTGIIVRNAQDVPEGLHIQAFPKGNAMAALLRGRFRTDAELDVGRLVFPAIRISSGRLEVQRLTLHLWGFLGQQQQPKDERDEKTKNDNKSASLDTTVEAPTRFPKQFDLHAHDWTFSRHDLLFSPCIRNGLRRLLVRILRDRGVQSSSIEVTCLDILPSGKISVKGQAKTLFGSPLNFEVRSGIDFSSRGHVLTFPGLEVSLTGDLGLFVPVMPTLDMDVGHNARFRDIHIDGQNKLLRLSASVTITPQRTIRLNDYQQSKEAFSARFSIDVGQWLTNLGNFKH